MSRSPEQRIDDIVIASELVLEYGRRDVLGEVDSGLAFDATRMRLLEIGEAVRTLPPSVLTMAPEVRWAEIAGMRNHLAHRYFDTLHAIVTNAATQHVPILLAAARRIAAELAAPAQSGTDRGGGADATPALPGVPNAPEDPPTPTGRA